MGIIHVLDPRVANQIAAGEVIERPSSAVKELLENALDANAKNISIEIVNGGLDLIKVTDDGDGFFKDDLPLAIERHATSKIDDFNDVYRLKTFGFRGEALASIAVISRLRITSGRNETEPAAVLSTEAGGEISRSVSAPRKGTCIEVRDLYYNVPARKKFVRSNSHESALIYDLICKFALGFPKINFTYLNNGEVIFSSNQLNTVDQLLSYIYGEATEGEILHFKNDAFYQQQSVEGWFFPPTVTRKNRSHMTYFVNDRLIESKELDQIVDEAIYTLVPKGRFLICVLKLYLPAFNIDVNVHPSKKVIKFKNLEDWKNVLIALIKEELWLSRLSVPFPATEPSMSSFALKQQKLPSTAEPLRLDFSIENKETSASQNHADSATETERCSITQDFSTEFVSKVPFKQADVKIAEHDAPYGMIKEPSSISTHNETAENNDNATSKDAPSVPLTQATVTELEYIGQLNQTFILAQDRDNLYIIDQHTLHERILYEKFMAECDAKMIAKQPLLHPVRLKLSPLQEGALVRNIFILDRLGFTVENSGALQYDVRTIPVLLSRYEDLQTLFNDLLDDLANEQPLKGLADIDEGSIIMASCKAAVKAHYKLSESEVKYLFREMTSLKNPHTCPHGRPIIMNISMNELYLFFKRGSY